MTAGRQRRQGWTRPFALPEQLADLTGPTSGVVHLPLSVYSSGIGPARGFDLADEGQRIVLYETVLTCGTRADQGRYLDADELRRLWPRLWLPAPVRQAWEQLLQTSVG